MDVWSAAKATLDNLDELGMREVCFIGSLAAKLYGNDREPNDVDVMILDSQYTPAEIKKKIARWDSRFYTADAPPPIWTILYYRPPGGSVQIKIDILTPGCAELPSFPPRQIDDNNARKLPTAPLLLVLLHKVLGWRKHSKSQKYTQFKRHFIDASDVVNLLSIAQQRGVTAPGPSKFIDSARTWVNEFIAAYPRDEIRNGWISIGFEQEIYLPAMLILD